MRKVAGLTLVVAGVAALAVTWAPELVITLEGVRWQRVLVGGIVMALGMAIWAAVFFGVCSLWSRWRCLFGRHPKKWVAVYKRHFTSYGDYHSVGRMRHYHRINEVWQVARWVCDRPGCRGMGEICMGDVDDALYTVEFGKLIPDEKGWANP